MIELRRIVLVNWHLLTRADLDLAGDGAVLGQNWSGKSTLIDLIQAVFAGGSPRLFRFNRSAGEGGGRSDRTLAGYCLGQLNEDTFLRDEARSHIALVFEDSSGTKLPVSIGLAIEASRGQQAEVVGHFIAEGVRLDTGMLLDEAANGLRPTDWPVLKRRLEQKCRAAGGELHTPEDARSFIREYMRLLFTKRRTSDPERFVRTFVAALSFTDMTSVEQFVHRYLLERREIDIAELRELIQRYREVQKTIADLKRRLDALQAMRVQIETFDSLLKEEEDCRAMERLALLIEAGAALHTNLRELRRKLAEQSQAAQELERVEAEIGREQQALEAIRRQLAASEAAGQRVIVRGEIRELDREHAAVMARLQRRYLDAARAMQLLEMRDRLGVINPGELVRALEAVRAASQDISPPDWPRNPATMDALLDATSVAALALRAKAVGRRDDAIAWRTRLNTAIAEDEERLNAAQAGRITLQAGTLRLMEALRREGMMPRTLCEVAEVIDERWRGALEALLVRDREAVIVESEHAARATEILRRGRGDYPNCRVANTRRLQSLPATAKEGTLAAMLRSQDTLAMAFAVFRIGNVQLAEDQEALLSGGRAVMADGAYYDGLVTEMRRADELKIGLAAAPLMAASLTQRITENKTSLAAHRQNAEFFEDVIRRLEDCARPFAPQETLAAISLELDGLAERRADARNRLGKIATMVDPELLDGERRSTALLKEFAGDRDSLIRQLGSLGSEVSGVRRRMGAGDGEIGSYLCLRQRRHLFRATVRAMAQLRALREPYRALRSKAPAKIAVDMALRAREAMEGHRALDREIRSAMGRYALDFPDTLENYGGAAIISTIKPWVEEGIKALEENELIRYRRQADEASDRVSGLFRTTFIHELNSRFGTLHAEMETLSRALRARPLHGETYQLHEMVKPEFEDLYRLARDSEHDELVLGGLFGYAAPRDERHARALRQVEQLLSDDAYDFTVYQDYRNYFTFDLRMRDVATGRTTSFDRRRGVASGAERQVPFYVVIGAALASIYHGARQTSSPSERGIGLAVFDEAFSKMDGPNQRTLLDFYRAIGLQVVIAAPTEKRAVVYENLDYIIDVFRSGDAALAELIQIKERVREQMRAANPQYTLDEALVKSFGLEAEAAE